MYYQTMIPWIVKVRIYFGTFTLCFLNALNSDHISFLVSINSFDLHPCLKCALAMRVLPSCVIGPVDFPPCIRHRAFPLIAGF